MKKSTLILKSIFLVGVIMTGATNSYAKKGKEKSLIPIPNTQKSYTIQELYVLINTNNPNKSSNFLIALDGQDPITQEKAGDWSNSGIDGSASAKKIGLTKAWVKEHADMKVMLHKDPKLVKYLHENGPRVLKEHMNQYENILLYFDVSIGGVIYKAFLNDPWPGKISSSSKSTNNPALNIISKWENQGAEESEVSSKREASPLKKRPKKRGSRTRR